MVFAARNALLALASMMFLMDRADGHGHHHHGRHLGEVDDIEDRCGQAMPTKEEQAMATYIVDEWVHERKKNRKDRQLHDRKEEVVIRTHFHIITNGNLGRHVSKRQIDQSLAVINAAYEIAGFKFKNMDKKAIYTDNSAWYALSSQFGVDEYNMKTDLHKGDAADLNVYLTDTSNAGAGGWASFPDWYANDPIYDGVVIHNEAIPGGSQERYNQGDTLTHEVGHWLGLYHTYPDNDDEGCDGDGDGVDDTPAEIGRNSECIERNSCPLQAGNDPIHNFMVRRFSSLLFFAEPAFFGMSQPLPFFRCSVLSF
jgi:hypothetical protein